MKTTLRILALTVFMYLIGAFIAGSWNSAEWVVPSKAILTFFYVVVVLILLTYEY